MASAMAEKEDGCFLSVGGLIMRMKNDDPYEVAAMTDTDDGATDFRSMSEPRRAYWADRFIRCCDLGPSKCMTWSVSETGTLRIAPGWFATADGNTYEAYTVSLNLLLACFAPGGAIYGNVSSHELYNGQLLLINGFLKGTTIDAWVCFRRQPLEV